MLRKVKFQGFSLIEVSISLIIIGIISSIGISQLRLMNKVYSSQKTQINMDFVVKSLGAYCTSKGMQLPYPSKINANIGYQSEDMKHSFGLIPFKSLGIMEKFAKDGNGHWMLYKMNPNFGKVVFASEDKKLGISDFDSDIPGDRVAFIIKSKNSKNEDELTIWYSERTFVDNYTKLTNDTICTSQNSKTKSENIVFLKFAKLWDNCYNLTVADVVELVDTQDLGSCGSRRGGSSPFIRTRFTVC